MRINDIGNIETMLIGPGNDNYGRNPTLETVERLNGEVAKLSAELFTIKDDRRWKLAGMAMQGLLAMETEGYLNANLGHYAETAVKLADALIAELEKEKK